MKRGSKISGFSLLETAVTMSVILPVLMAIVGFADYAHLTGKIKRLAVDALPEINTPVIKVSQSNTGDYFSRINSDNMRSAFDSFHQVVRDRVTSTLGINPVTQRAFYRLEIGFVGYLIDVRSGNLDSQGPGLVGPIADWSSANPPSNYARNKAIYARCWGALNTSLVNVCPPHVCPANNCQGSISTAPQAAPQFGLSPLYDRFMLLGQSQATDSEFKVMAVSSPLKGAYRQVYYGESHEMAYPAYTNQQALTDNLDYTTHNYLRHSAVFGIHISVDLRYRFTGKIMQTMGLNPVFTVNHLSTPRSFF